MGRMTINIPDALMEKLRREHPDVNWAEVARRSLIRWLEKFENLREKGLL